jgi:VIT1/CCC1 family predicted Fe2+/Mn2+ transporter
MKHSLKVGFNFGLTSGIITTLGLMVGLHSSTHSKLVVIGGILTIAIADALSDAMGIHMAEESENKHTTEEVWESTFSTILFKFIFSSIFILPVLLIELSKAIIISVMFGLYILLVNSFVIAREQNTTPWKIIGEHLIIAVLVIIATHYIGHFISILLR